MKSLQSNWYIARHKPGENARYFATVSFHEQRQMRKGSVLCIAYQLAKGMNVG